MLRLHRTNGVARRLTMVSLDKTRPFRSIVAQARITRNRQTGAINQLKQATKARPMPVNLTCLWIRSSGGCGATGAVGTTGDGAWIDCVESVSTALLTWLALW